MKQLTQYGLLVALLLPGLGARGQTSGGRAVLAAAGQTFTAGGLMLDWTAGEVAVASWQPAGAPQLLEGFHHRSGLPGRLAEDVSVFPNPFKTEVWVRVPAATAAVQVEVYDLRGQLLRSLTETPGSNSVRLSLADLPVGGYVLRVYNASQRQHSTHFVLRND